MASHAVSPDKGFDDEPKPLSATYQDGSELTRLLQRMTAETVLPVISEYLLTMHAFRRGLLQQPTLRAAVVQDLARQDPTAITVAFGTSFPPQPEPTRETDRLSDPPNHSGNVRPEQLSNSEPSIRTDHRDKTEAELDDVGRPVSSAVDPSSSVPLAGLSPGENKVDGLAVGGQGKAVLPNNLSANPTPQGGNVKRKRPTTAWKPKVISEEFVYSSSDTDDPTLPSLWERENTRWSKAGLGEVWSDAVASLDRDDKTSVQHARGLFSKARFIIQQSRGKQLRDFVVEIERLHQYWGKEHRTAGASVGTMDGIEQFRRGWTFANKENEAGKSVQSALKSNALADIYEGYFNIPTTDNDSIESSASAELVDGGPKSGLEDTGATMASTVPQGSGLFVSPFPVAEVSTRRRGRRATRRVTHMDATANGIRAKKVMALGLGIVSTKLTQTLNKSRNYATLRRGVGGPAIFTMLSNTPRSL